MKLARATAWVTAGLIAGALLSVAAFRALLVAPPEPPGAVDPVEFRIDPGEPFADVARRLDDAELVVSALRFRILARLDGADRNVRAGTYLVAPGTAPRDLLQDLVEGNVRLVRVTVPEGRRLEQIAGDVERALGVPADSVLAAARNPALLAVLECPGPDAEGYLFPETYHFPDGVSAAGVVRAMTRRFELVWETLPESTHPDYTRHEIVTLASIVEAETPLDGEKPRVAAVYWNRLDQGWKLQADPTVRYGLKKFTGRLYYKHLDIDTPYNSYMYEGLPPGPIGAPGRLALEAALQPLDPCDDMFFVASGNGGHVFTKTQRDHVRAKQAARGGS